MVNLFRYKIEKLISYGGISLALSNLVTSCTSRLNKKFDLDRVECFIKRTPNLGNAAEAFQNALETIQTNIRWTQKNMQPIFDWLKTESTLRTYIYINILILFKSI